MSRGAEKAGVVRVTGYDVVRVLLGLLLLTTAGLKAHQLATEPVLGDGVLQSRWFLIGVVEFELFFGLWLLAGLFPWRTWLAALGCFGLFACVSLFKAFSGEVSCGCFGQVPVNPWYTTTLDLAIVLSLIRWRPCLKGTPMESTSENGLSEKAVVPIPGTRSGFLSVALLFVAMGLAYWAILGESSRTAGFLVPSPAIFDFGNVTEGRLSGEFRLTNESRTAIQILHVLVSCSCHRVNVPRKRIEPGQSARAAFQWDARPGTAESQAHFIVAYKLDDEDHMRYTTCRFRAHVSAPFVFEPSELTFSSAKKEVQTARVKFSSGDVGDFVVTGARCVHPAFSVACNAKENVVVVSYDPDKWHADGAEVSARIRVTTSCDSDSESFVPVRVRE